MTRDHEPRAGLVEWMAMTVDCPEPNIMADFYAVLLGGTVTRRVPGEANVDASGWLINFRAAPGYKPPTWPSPEVPLHAHFEYVVEDPYAAAQELVALGASLAAHPRAHYDHRRQAGDRHASALHNTFNRMLGCLFYCLQTSQLYDEATAFGPRLPAVA